MQRFLTAAVAGLLVLAAARPAAASDRNARMIDTLAVQADVFEDGDAAKATLWSETAIASPQREWAFLLGGGAGRIAPDNGRDVDFWEAGVGLKYALSPLTSVALTFTYGLYYDLPGDPDVRTGALTLKHRFVPADRPVAPYIAGTFGYRSLDEAYDGSTTEDYSEMLGRAALGCDFMLTDTLAIVLEGALTHAEDVSGEFETPDTWSGSLGFKGYWD
jgi:hypothetical protein